MTYTGFPGGSVVKNPPAMHETQEMQVWSLSREDRLEKEMATHSRILAWKILWAEEPGGLYIVHRVVKSQTQPKQLSMHDLSIKKYTDDWVEPWKVNRISLTTEDERT